MAGLPDQPQVAVRATASVEALEMIYRRRFHQFVRVAQAITRSRELAVDAVQDAFASALRNRFAFRGDGALESWVWRSVVNAARRQQRDRLHLLLDERDRVADQRPDNDDVRAVIAGLPERQRLVLFLRYYADLDYRAIAAALEIDVGTVGSTLHQAQKAVRRQLTGAEC